jgi:acyl-CoA reductase-like NAD-dependent aldehyde dehydrogenase
VGVVHQAGAGDLEEAIQAATRAFEVTRKLPGYTRAATLRAIADTIASRAEEFARIIALEAGKPIKQARAEVTRAISTFATAAEEASRLARSPRSRRLTSRSIWWPTNWPRPSPPVAQWCSNRRRKHRSPR